MNAQTLAPDEMRWPYYLGAPVQEQGRDRQAPRRIQAGARAAARRFPDAGLARPAHLDQGRPEEAEPLFAKALSADAAVGGGAGRTRPGRSRQARLTRAPRAISRRRSRSIPEAESLHSPLAMAYRGLGQLDKAAPHLRQWSNADILLPDPLQQELDLLLESGLSYELRGVRALERQGLATQRPRSSERAWS